MDSVAMGFPVHPIIANMYTEYFEERLLEQWTA